LKAAKRLKIEYGFEPIYWVGDGFDNSDEFVSENFPDAIFHARYDACKGVFPESTSVMSAVPSLNLDFIRQHAAEELLAIKMMDRMDFDRHSFSFIERQRHYRNQVNYWMTYCLTHKPDLLVVAAIPHICYDYILHLVCDFLSIPCLFVVRTFFPCRAILLTSLHHIDESIGCEYAKVLNSDITSNEIKKELPGDVLNSLLSIQEQSYEEARPDYMKVHDAKSKRAGSFFGLISEGNRAISRNKDWFLGKYSHWGRFPFYLKQRQRSIEKSTSNLIQHFLRVVIADRYKRGLRKHYLCLTQQPDFKRQYIIFNMHYQPEATTSPAGNIFVDQKLCIESLLKYLPDGWFLYVKENSNQFQPHLVGQTSRIKEFYDDIALYERVVLIAPEVNSFELTKHARAVSTVTGTAGWEAMALGKPVIIFGQTWYEKYAGVHKVSCEESASRISEFLEGFEYNERNLLAYLLAFSRNTINAYTAPITKADMDMPEDECVDNLVRAIVTSYGCLRG